MNNKSHEGAVPRNPKILWRDRRRHSPSLEELALQAFSTSGENAAASFPRTPVDMADVEENLGDRFHIIPGSMPISQRADGDSPLGVSKGSAIEAVLEHVGYLLRMPWMGRWNDVEMFDICGEAVAMAGADEGVKARANRVTTSIL